jgi:NAD(P)-dependent dehydrogenase (short-subunit alcohol dehydrogenase family)
MSEGKSVLVTGGSRGIGAAISLLAAQRGYRVAVNYHSNGRAAEKVVGEIAAACGEAFAVQGDASSETDIVFMFAEIDRRFGRLDALVNNAGVVDRKARLDQMDAGRIEHMLRVNVLGPMLCAREAVKRMSPLHGCKGGSIVNISSVAAVLGSAGEYVDYAGAKGAIESFTRGLAREVAAEGIRVNCVRPGTIDTEIHASGGQPDRAARVAPLIPVQRPGTAAEVAEAVLYLLSDAASYSTGAILDVSGGR